ALVSPTPPSYEEATAGTATHYPPSSTGMIATSGGSLSGRYQKALLISVGSASLTIYLKCILLYFKVLLSTHSTMYNYAIVVISFFQVYAILMIQLLVTLAIVAIFTFCDPVKDYIQSNPSWYWASYAVFFVTYLTLSCCSAPRRRFPWNLILLCIFLSLRVSCLNSFYNTKSVVMCLGITAAVCLLVTVFSFQTKFDVTSYQGVLFVFCMVMFLSGLVLTLVLPFQYVPWLDATYAVLGAILFTMFLAFDTQLLMGNKRYSMSPEEYVFASLNIYLDIIYIFSFFLQIFGTKQE
uniref:Protein lifeguard 2 n=1 Tax=Cyclopterus lumpus TaxID=8103 RepID=A0A8C2XIY7_CYCLU